MKTGNSGQATVQSERVFSKSKRRRALQTTLGCLYSGQTLRDGTHMVHIAHRDFWQLIEEVPVLLTAWGLSQAHGSLIQGQAVPCSHLGIRQPCGNALDSLAKNVVPHQHPESPWPPPLSSHDRKPHCSLVTEFF